MSTPGAGGTPVLPPGVFPPTGEGGGADGANPPVPTLIARAVGESARAELMDYAKQLSGMRDTPARMALTGREVTSLDPANRAIVDSQLDAASGAAQAKQAIESAVAPAQTYAAHQAVGAREANIGDYGLSAQQQQARQDELYARADALLRGMEGTHDATFGERLQDMGGSMSKAFGGTDVAQENAKRLDANKFEAVKLLAEQFGRAGTMGAVGRTDADKVQALRQAAVDAQLAFEQRKAENAPMEGGPPLYGTDRQAAQQQAEPQAPTVAKPAEHGAKPKGTPQQQLRAFVKTLAAPAAPETKAQRTLRELMDKRGTRGNLNQSDAESPLSGGIADVMRETPADTAAPAAPVAQAAPASPVAAAAAALERKYPGPYDQDPNPRVTRASVMHTETDMEKARSDAAKNLAALGHGGLGEKRKFAMHGGTNHRGEAVKVYEKLMASGDVNTAQAIHQRAGDEANMSHEGIAQLRADAKRGATHGEAPVEQVARGGENEYMWVPNKKDHDLVQKFTPAVDVLTQRMDELIPLVSTTESRAANAEKIRVKIDNLSESAQGMSAALSHSNRASDPVIRRALGATGALTSADLLQKPDGTILGPNGVDILRGQIDTFRQLRGEILNHVNATPVFKGTDSSGEPHFRFLQEGGTAPTAPSPTAPTPATPGGSVQFVPDAKP